MNITGGCQCGAVRYRICGELVDASFCHCSMCRKVSGAPVTAWATFPVSAFEYIKGEAGFYHSSVAAQREYCPHCGAQLVFRFAENPSELDVSISTMDDVNAVQPEFHIWVKNKVPWLIIGDDLPQYSENEPASD